MATTYPDEEGTTNQGTTNQGTLTSSRCHNLPIHNPYHNTTTSPSQVDTTYQFSRRQRTNSTTSSTPQPVPTLRTTLKPPIRKCSRRSLQRSKSKQKKVWKESIQRQISMEKQCHREEHLKITSTITKRIQHTYGFTPSLQISIHQNAQNVLGKMQQSDYSTTVNNLTFHNLTTGNILPTSASLLLGLGLKFIPTPRHNITQKDLDITLSRFD
jgi:hypothetical protein